jgi:cobalt transporter subunit CbtB
MQRESAVASSALAGTASSTRESESTWLPVLLAASLGVFLLWGVGFSHVEALHNAAHDMRHSNAFPCH